ncbi:hypothetical protein VPH35_057364 [Triticum aestivum]
MVTPPTGPPLRITHPSHPGHVLTLYATGGALFQCDGCRHYGEDDRRYRCDPCDFDLHVCCVPFKVEDLTLTHPFFKGCTFDFRYSPPGGALAGRGSFCGACGDQVLGFMFHDGHRQIGLHPQCANLAERVVQHDGAFDLLKESPAHGRAGERAHDMGGGNADDMGGGHAAERADDMGGGHATGRANGMGHWVVVQHQQGLAFLQGCGGRRQGRLRRLHWHGG